MHGRVLIVYGTSYGQTDRITQRVEGWLRADGIDVTRRNAAELSDRIDISEYDGIIVAASMVMHHYQPAVQEFVATHASALNDGVSAFLAVSGAAGSRRPGEREEAARLATAFCAEEGWVPSMIESVAGAIAYTKYNLVLRYVMKRISRAEGGSTDTTRDHEYTDWGQVERFAHAFTARLAEEARQPVGAG